MSDRNVREKLTSVSNSDRRRLRPTYVHPLGDQWAAPGGPWSGETLDDALQGDAEAEARVAAVAGGLLAAGVEPGEAVAWQLPNGPDAIALYRAAWRVGAVAAPIHHRAGPADAEALLARLDPAVAVGSGDPLPVGPPARSGVVDVDPAGLAVALATAGSTGTPKLALHTHRALVYKARLMAATHGLGPGDCVLLAPPLAHVSGLLNGILVTVSGMRAVPMARWDPSDALVVIERERVTFMVGPPAFFVSLTGAPGFSPDRVRSLRQVSCGGAGVTPAFVRSAAAALGCRVKRTYGSTEAPTVTTSTLDDDVDRAAEADGRPVGVAELRVVDPETGLDRAAGETGEVWVRGPELFVGYDDPAATEAAFAAGGWFRTGDLGTVSTDGWLTVVGRLKDVIIRGGENIAASEVEGVLEAHPAVRQAAVVGAPDQQLGERVCAFVEADAAFGLDACRAWFAERGVTRFKWPEQVIVVDELPLLPAGKPDRAALRARVGRPNPA
jgi:acyl-CoA synthetase (AMP-forming)/AMP-acid ligase II